MRYLLSLVCVLALGLMGCSETTGTGGSGGDGGNGGVGGDGGTGGLPTDCEGLEYLAECWYVSPSFSTLGACVDGTCEPAVESCTDVVDRIPCLYEDPASMDIELGVCEFERCVLLVEDCTGEETHLYPCVKGGQPGTCVFDFCILEEGCGDEVEDWHPCIPGGKEIGYCIAGECEPVGSACGDVDGVTCAVDWPADPGICLGGTCEPAVESCAEQEDGTPCFNGPDIGICEAGVCGLG